MTFSAIMACLDLESSNDVCLRIAVDLAAHFNAKLGSAGSRPPRAKKAPWSPRGIRKVEEVAVVELIQDEAARTAAHRRIDDVISWLDRHGIAAFGRVFHFPEQEESFEKLWQYGTNFIVAGAFDPSRLRERVFGGFTDDLLRCSPLCTFLSHYQMSDTTESDGLVAETKIEINLNRLSQLFNSLDPSPFHERDLDQDAEDYIVGSAEEAPRQHPLRLVIHLPGEQLPHTGVPDLATAVHHYFAYRETHERRRLRLLFRDGRIALVTGLAFLLSCMLLREVALSFGSGTIFHIIGEGMLISGWVAMWHPLEIFLYEWVPIRRRCRILAKLAKIPVNVQPTP